MNFSNFVHENRVLNFILKGTKYKMFRTYEYRLYPNKEQEVLLTKHFGCSRFVYNYMLGIKTSLYKAQQKSINKFEMCHQISEMKKTKELSWLKEVNAQSLNVAIYNLEKAFTGFFRDKKGYPKFKSKYARQSFACPQSVKVGFEMNKVFLPKFKQGIKCRFSRTFEGTIKTCTIKKTITNKYFISILVEDGLLEPKKPKIKKEASLGIDLGLKEFLILSNGEKVSNPHFYKKEEGRLKVLQKRASKKVKGSNNRKKANLKVALLHEKISNRRKDFIYKVIRWLFDKNHANTFCFESLKVQNMMKNHHLSKAIGDVSWSMFTTMMEGKCNLEGKNFLKIGTYEPSTKLCSNCGYIYKDITLDVREWTCPKCRKVHDRDVNAAINIRDIALRKENSGQELPAVPVEMSELSESTKQESPSFR